MECSRRADRATFIRPILPMKKKPSTIAAAKKKTGSGSAALHSVTAILALPKAPLTEAIHTTEHPGARCTHGSPGRGEIRQTWACILESCTCPTTRSPQALGIIASSPPCVPVEENECAV